MEASVKIEVAGLDEVRNLLELLQTHYNKLPKELQDALQIAADSGLGDIDADVAQIKYGMFKEYENSLELKRVLAINKVTKMVKYLDDDYTVMAVYPEHFWHSFDGRKVEEW